jgi:hypothetical protein
MAVNFAKLPKLPGQKVEREATPLFWGVSFAAAFNTLLFVTTHNPRYFT